MSDIEHLKPTDRLRVIDLVAQTGVDVTPWSEFKGPDPAANPKYCYNWTFAKPNEFVVAMLWHDDLEVVDGVIVHRINIRFRDGRYGGKGKDNWRRRSEELDTNLKTAYSHGLPVRVILLDGKHRDAMNADDPASSVKFRKLDTEAWSVTAYDLKTGECIISRGVIPTSSSEYDDPEIEGFKEGEQRRLYILHRRREAELRRKKIEAALIDNKGVLRCEVPKCNFDFAERYGPLGKDFAHVHHLEPLASAPKEGRTIKLKDLAIVCANCHAMIHRGGECRPLAGLIP